MLEHEKSIVWIPSQLGGLLKDRYPYVRETEIWAARRSGPPALHNVPGILVGYSTLEPDAPHMVGTPGRFARRVFWVKEYDPYDDGGQPSEAIDTDSVQVGVASWPRYRVCWCVTCNGDHPRSTKKLHREVEPRYTRRKLLEDIEATRAEIRAMITGE